MTIENPYSLEGKTILVTGAGSGIGRATAIKCSKLGATLLLVDINSDSVNSTLENLANQQLEHRCFVCDLTDYESLDKLCSEVYGLEGAVLCAGINKNSPIPFCTREKIDRIFGVNFYSSVELIRLLYKKKKLNKYSSIVMIASIGGVFKYTFGNAIYGASKSALNTMMKYAAREFASRMIRVNTICPGMIETPLIHSGIVTDEQHQKDMEQYPLKRYGKPEDIANGVVYLLSDAASWITGQSIVIDGGATLL